MDPPRDILLPLSIAFSTQKHEFASSPRGRFVFSPRGGCFPTISPGVLPPLFWIDSFGLLKRYKRGGGRVPSTGNMYHESRQKSCLQAWGVPYTSSIASSQLHRKCAHSVLWIHELQHHPPGQIDFPLGLAFHKRRSPRITNPSREKSSPLHTLTSFSFFSCVGSTLFGAALGDFMWEWVP